MNRKIVLSRNSRKGFQAWKNFAFLLFIAVFSWCLVALFPVPAASGAEGRLVKVGVYELDNLCWIIVVALSFLFLGIIIARLWFQKKNRELQAANAKLESAGKQYRQLVEDSPDIHFSTNHKGKITYISQSLTKITGYTVAEALGMQMEDAYVNPERRQDLLTALEKDGYVNDFISQLKRKDGSIWWASGDVKVYKDEHGSIMGVKGVVRDVTERMEAEHSLKAAYAIINQSPAVIFLWKNEAGWPVEYVSENVKNVFGYTAEEFLSGAVSYGDVIHPDDIERIKEDTAAYQKDYEENLIKQEYRIITKDEKVVWLDHRTFALRNETGEIIHYQGIVLDITKRKQMEKKLDQSEKKFRLMMESMSDLVYICSEDYRVEYMNPAMIKRTGRDATGELCYKALHDFDHPCSWCENEHVNQGVYLEANVISPKDEHSYHVSHSPIKNDDGTVSNMVVFRDTTKLKKMEAQLVQSQKLETIGTLAGGVAHDFNNILTIINGYAQILQMNLEKESPLFADVKQILAAGERAANLTRQLLAFSRKQVIMPRTVAINQVIVEMKKMLGRLISENIQLEISLDKQVGNIYADPGQLEQVIMNLVVNARDAINEQPMTGEKIIMVSTSRVFLDQDVVADHDGNQPGWYLQLQVEDNGIGMSKEVLGRIFEPFYTTKGVGKGTGMGLSMVYGIVKQNDGIVFAESEPGQGTTFKVYWPIKEAKKTVKLEAKKTGPPPGGREIILLAEDDPQLREISCRQLREAGYTVLEAENGLKALEVAVQHQGKIDLLFTDVVMPLMSGGELAEKIRKFYPEISILLASGYMDDTVQASVCNFGKQNLINKPYDLKDALILIRQLLDKKISSPA